MLSWFAGQDGGSAPASPPGGARSIARAPLQRRSIAQGLTPFQISSHLKKSGLFHCGRFKQSYVTDSEVLGRGTFGCVRRCFSAHAHEQGAGGRGDCSGG